MAPVQLVILAAGHGQRFGGLKQLAPIGPNDEAIMDYTARSAEVCGFDGIVVVVREEIREEILAHIRRNWPSSIQVDLVCQPPRPGTAQAVLSARPALEGPFGVANADDLYGEIALRAIVEHFSMTSDPGSVGALSERELGIANRHLLVAYRLVRTILTSATVTRGLCEVGRDGQLRRIVELDVHLRDDRSFDATPHLHPHDPTEDSKQPKSVVLTGNERVSMNLWGFHERMLDHLEEALRSEENASVSRELLLPEAVGSLVANRTDGVHVVDTTAYCIGVTHREDAAIVRRELVKLESGADEIKIAQR